MENYTVDIAQLSKGTGRTNNQQEDQGSQQGGLSKYAQQAEDEDTEKDDVEDDVLGNYSVDLGALGDKPSSILVGDRELERDRIPSEDAGPEDFTINLKKWIRGDEKWKKEKLHEENGDVNGIPETLESRREVVYEGSVDEENFSEQASSSPCAKDDCPVKDQDQDFENRPPIGRSTTQLQEDAAEEVFQRISALQAEVECMREEEENRRVVQRDWESENKNLRKENDEARRQLHELTNLLQGHEIERKDNLATGILIKNVEELVGQNKDLKTQLTTTREGTDQLRSELQALECRQSGEIDRLRKQIEEQKNVAKCEREKCLVLAQEAAKLAENRQRNDNTIQKLTDEVKARELEVNHANEQIWETRRINKDVENENDRLVQENKRQIQEAIGVQKQLQSKIIELQAAHTTIADLREAASAQKNIDDTEASDNTKAREKASKEGEAKAAVESMRTSHAKDLETLRSALQNAIQARQKSENTLQRSHKEQCLELQQQIKDLEQRLDCQQEAPSTHSIEDELRSAIRVLSNKLEKAYTSIRALRVEAEAARQEARATVETNEAVNAELEARFADAMETREKEWMRRANLLFREREKMGKVLLQEWGRAEVGQAKKGERQAYRYKYVRGRF